LPGSGGWDEKRQTQGKNNGAGNPFHRKRPLQRMQS
jgi:hypothetical protein